MKIAHLKKREEKVNHIIFRLQQVVTILRSEVEYLNYYIASELDETIIFQEEEEEEEVEEDAEKVEK